MVYLMLLFLCSHEIFVVLHLWTGLAPTFIFTVREHETKLNSKKLSVQEALSLEVNKVLLTIQWGLY